MPCNYKLYPSNWKTEIRSSILKRANNCCENCGVQNSFVVSSYKIRNKTTWVNQTIGEWYRSNCPRRVKVVLTIAHLDHDITNNCPSNLKALCQKCHLSYDAEHHKKNASQTLKIKK